MESKIDLIAEQVASMTLFLSQLAKRVDGVESVIHKPGSSKSSSPHVDFASSGQSAVSPEFHSAVSHEMESPLLSRSKSFHF